MNREMIPRYLAIASEVREQPAFGRRQHDLTQPTCGGGYAVAVTFQQV